MAAAIFNHLVDPAKARAISAGTSPAPHVHPEVITVMRELGVDLSHASTRRLTEKVARQAHWLVTMGCGDECPTVPGARRDDWALDDPKGKSLEQVRRIRDDIRRRVESLVDHEQWRA